MINVMTPLTDFDNMTCLVPPGSSLDGFLFHAQAVHFLFRLRKDHAANFQRRRRALLGWEDNRRHQPTIGLQIRRGDKCNPKTPTYYGAKFCRSMYAGYHKAVLSLQRKYAVRHIFLATDDRHAVTACRSWKTFLCQSSSDPGRGANSVLNQHNNRSVDITLSVLFDVDTIGWCSYFVGASPGSQVSTIAWELLVARKGHHVPFVNFGRWRWADGGGSIMW